MLRVLRRVTAASFLLATMFASAHAQSVCDRLAPVGLLPPAGGFTFGCSRQFTLKLGAALGPDGNYILLDDPACANGPCAGLSGIPQMQCAATSGYFCCITNAQMIPTI